VIQKRETDLVVGSFGRGAYILDDYTALRDVSAQALAEEARLFPLRDAYMFNELGQIRAAWGDPVTPNPPYGAVFTYSVGKPPAADTKLVLSISDDAGTHVRRIELTGDRATLGVHRVAWDLRGEAPEPAAGQVPTGGGRGGGRQGGPAMAAGRYRATLGKLSGETVTPVGAAQTFMIVPLPR
jgi:hypothetical protein